MDMMVWAGIGAIVAVIAIFAPTFAPARTTVLIDTPTSIARVEMRSLWGMGPTLYRRLLPQNDVSEPLPSFADAPRIGSALMTPGLADAVYHALQRLFALKSRSARFELRLNLGDPAQNRVVETAVHAALAVAPAAVREAVVITKSEAPGAEISAKFEIDASPSRIASIHNDLKNARAVREFLKRLKKKPAPPKRPVREVRTT